MSSFRFRVAACYSSTFKDPVDKGPNKFSNRRIFYQCNPSTQPCKFCFSSVYASAYKWNHTGKNFDPIRPKKTCTLPFKKLQSSARPVWTKGRSVQVFVRSKNVPGPVQRGSFTLNGTLQMMPFLTLWTRARSRFAVLKLSFVLLPTMLFFPSWFVPKTQTKRTHCVRVLPRQ